MPVYLYRNLTTGETFEVEQRITEPALATHPTTGDPVKRLVQPVGIAFKGSGFYVTDSRSTGPKAAKADGVSKDGAAGDGASKATGSGAATYTGSTATTAGSKGDAPPPAASSPSKATAAATD